MPISTRRLSTLVFGLIAATGWVAACDEEADPDEEHDRGDVPEVVDGCPDGDDLVGVGETRTCTCDDGTEAEQTCLSTGEYADCQCAGGGW